MFGIALASLDQISEEEKTRYRSLYCGLCRAIKTRYGQVSRLSLNYDLVLLAMLFDSLYEPEETSTPSRCITHPTKRVTCVGSEYVDYAADLSVAFAYFKCLDDVDDEGGIAAKMGTAALAGPYKKAHGRIPQECDAIERSTERMRKLERNPDAVPSAADALADEFGEILSVVFSRYGEPWKGSLEGFGFHLGRFVYLMDAAIDQKEDAERGSFNPLLELEMGQDAMREMLENEIGNAARYFEVLPLERDLNLMRSVLYSGVWQKFNMTFPPANTEANGNETTRKAEADR